MDLNHLDLTDPVMVLQSSKTKHLSMRCTFGVVDAWHYVLTLDHKEPVIGTMAVYLVTSQVKFQIVKSASESHGLPMPAGGA